MSRCAALFLAVLLSFQATWASAATYCQHEAAPALAKHFGHHDHQHKLDLKKPSDEKSIDSDCGICHVAGAGSIAIALNHVTSKAVAESFVVPPRHASRSALARAPDRPQWLRLA